MKNSKNSFIFLTLSLLFIISCIILVIFIKEDDNGYIEIIDTKQINYSNKIEFDITDSSATSQSETENRVAADDDNAATEKININTASLDELVTLKGIGEAIGQRIIDYRIANGKFYTIEEIMEVNGIGIKVFEKLKDFITV